MKDQRATPQLGLSGGFMAAWWAEVLKARRSKLPWVTALALVLATGVGGLFMYIQQDPARARSLGLLGTKAQLTAGTADWPSYFALLAQVIAVGGLLVFGLVVVWVFGREFTDRTVKDLLALPTSREAVVVAKFALSAVWCLLLGAQTYALGLMIGAFLDLPGWAAGAATQGLLRLLVTTVLTIVLTWPFALAASVGRGYLVGVGCMFAALFVAQVTATLGYGQYVPWSVPSLYSGLAGVGRATPGPTGFTLVALTGLIAVVGTCLWWRRADHTT